MSSFASLLAIGLLMPPLTLPAAAVDRATAIVTQDQTALRAAPQDSAQRHALLWQGDTLEVRAERLDYLQVYDHRRERAGYVRASQVRRVSLAPEQAAELLAVARFLYDTPGAEALGLAYVAAYLKAAPAEVIGSEAFDAFGVFAERLARRASSRWATRDDRVIAAHLEVAAGLGATVHSFESEGRMKLCYDGEAFRRVLALPASDAQRARAALALTHPECIDPNLTPTARYALDVWRAEVMARAPLEQLPTHVQNRLRLRNASVQASLAFQRARRGEDASEVMASALRDLAAVDGLQLAEADAGSYDAAALRVGASRWAAEHVPRSAGLSIETSTGTAPGQTCIDLVDGKGVKLSERRCTYGVVWPASARANGPGTALTLAVQPLEGWRELWVFRKLGSQWQVDVVPPALGTPDLGYIEFAGWVAGKPQLLAAREIRVDGRFQRSFEILDLRTLVVVNRADSPSALTPFHRWQDAVWKRQTLSLR